MRNNESTRMPRITNISFWLAFFIVAAALLVSYSILARAQTQNVNEPTDQEIKASGITFPIPELGNCGSKDECKSYCNDQGHMDVCISFAKSHGLMNKDEADRAEKFRNDLQNGAGPGGCASPSSCQSFCSDVKNIEVCVKFAEEHGFKDKHIEQAQKLLDYMKAGGQTPGGCTSEDSCRQYCGDFSHAEECFNFAKKAGIVQARGQQGESVNGQVGSQGFEQGNVPNEEQFQKFVELAKSGETPGGCKSKEECESYCQDQSHLEACLSFGEKVGFVSHDEADMVRKSGGKGPGGCNSRESCESFCNDPAHQEECFKFAEEHGFVQHEEVQRAKEGFVRLRAGLEQAPPEVVECLKSVVGENALNDIQSGKITPGPEIGQSVKGCFEKFGHKGNSTEIFKNAPPEVVACLQEKLGDDFAKVQSGAIMPTPEMGDTFRVCSQQVQLENGNFGGPGAPQVGEQGGQQGGKRFGPPPGDFLRNAPPGVSTCLKEKLGDQFDKVRSGETQPTQELGQTLKSCFESFNPHNEYKGFNPGGGPGEQGQEDLRGQQGERGQEGEGNFEQGGQQGGQGEQGDAGEIDSGETSEGDQGFQGGGIFPGSQGGQVGQPTGGEKPLFNKQPYYQSVPSFNAPSGTYSQPNQQQPGGLYPYPSTSGTYPSGTYPSGGSYPSSGASSGTYPTYPSGTTYPSSGAYPSGTYPSGGIYPSGTTYQSSTSAYPSGTTYPSSGSGSYSTDPATNCAKAGGTWDTSTNYCKVPGSTSPSPSGTTQTCPSGQYWNGTSCVSSTTTAPPPGANLFQILKSFLFGR